MRPAFHPDQLLGTTLDGRYRLVSHLASGGMSAVFRGEEVGTGRSLAVKVLRPEHVVSLEITARFVREAEVIRSIVHPNVIRVFDAGQTPDGLLFMSMELLEGESLFERLRREGRTPPAEAVFLLVQVCAGLEAAHARGVVHRDLKPENVFLHAPDRQPALVKLLDFGLAQVAGAPFPGEAGMAVGTPEFLSPEQARGLPVDARSDIYAVGVMAWRMLAGRHPFPVSDPRQLMERHAQDRVPPLAAVRPELGDLPALVDVVTRACEKSAALRPASAAAMGRELAAAIPGGGSPNDRTHLA